MENTRLITLALLIFFIFAISIEGNSQYLEDGEWKLKKQDGKLKVFTRTHPDSPIKEIRVTTNVKATTEELLQVLGDVSNYSTWVYKCKEARKVQINGKNDYIYYTHSDLPFPASDRDLVIHSRQHIDPVTGIIHARSVAVQGMVPEKKGVIRIEKFESRWTITPRPDGTIDIDTSAMTDPGGSIPAWIVNWTISMGPLKTIKEMSELIEELHRKKSMSKY